MKSITVLIDTNIILDWIMARQPNMEYAKKIMEMCLFGNLNAYITAHTIADLFYILRKDFSVSERKELLKLLCDRLNIIAENKTIILNTLNNDMWSDLEDGLQMQCAITENLDFIITQNIKDFKNISIKVLNSQDFLELIEK